MGFNLAHFHLHLCLLLPRVGSASSIATLSGSATRSSGFCSSPEIPTGSRLTLVTPLGSVTSRTRREVDLICGYGYFPIRGNGNSIRFCLAVALDYFYQLIHAFVSHTNDIMISKTPFHRGVHQSYEQRSPLLQKIQAEPSLNQF